jgi:hypothetical protein
VPLAQAPIRSRRPAAHAQAAPPPGSTDPGQDSEARQSTEGHTQTSGAACTLISLSTGCRTRPSVQDHGWARSSRNVTKAQYEHDARSHRPTPRQFCLTVRQPPRSGVRRGGTVGPESPPPSGSGSRRSHRNPASTDGMPRTARAGTRLHRPPTSPPVRRRVSDTRHDTRPRVHTFLSLIKAAPAAPRGPDPT